MSDGENVQTGNEQEDRPPKNIVGMFTMISRIAWMKIVLFSGCKSLARNSIQFKREVNKLQL